MTDSAWNMGERRAALEKSAEVWRRHAGGRAASKTAWMSLAEALACDSDEARGMPVCTLIASLPGIGKLRAPRILAELEISPTLCIQGLDDHERQRLLARFTTPH